MKPPATRVVLLAGLLTVAFLASCQRPSHQESELFVLVTANVSLPYWQEAQAGFLDAARTLGVKAEVAGPDSYSPDEELAVFQRAVQRHPAGILVSPTRPNLFKPAIDSAIQQGIPVITVDSDSPDSRRILFIGTDNFRAGMESGKRLAELLHGQGSVVLLTIPGQLNLGERLRGVQEVLKNYPNITIAETLDDKGNAKTASDQVAAVASGKAKVNAILCLEASGGPGAAQALSRLNMKIPIIAMDKDPATLDGISQGTITATVAQKPYTMSFYGLKLLDDLHHNVVHEFRDWRTAPVSPLPALVDTGTAVIDSGNVAAFKAAQATRPGAP